ncbi:hypothetical protein C0Z19_02380 [Trinickia soli]|uniref:Uncharacterized protein n=1 Tax=Trinickia soli TaxID=380675 RepID=A0A2N7WDY4_9BURK|nr:hypothetical protein CIW54_27170 [Paraburkholderia sp. T12-10]PMS27555.1 hypothetical protein C0Z19_02380 [Trinickia soli]
MGRLALACNAGPARARIVKRAAQPRSSRHRGRGKKAAFGLRAAVGSAAAPGGAGEALVGQTSSSGVRLSDCQFINRRGAPAS